MSWYFKCQTRAAISSAGLKTVPEGGFWIDCVPRFRSRSKPNAVTTILSMLFDKESETGAHKKGNALVRFIEDILAYVVRQ